MGQKVNPIAPRLRTTRTWSSKWISTRDSVYRKQLLKDIKLREFIFEKYLSANISDVVIERSGEHANITILSGRPGVLIGKKGGDSAQIKSEAASILGCKVHVKIEELKKPELDAKIQAEAIAAQLLKRVQFRKAMKRAASNVMSAGAKGVKILISGRLGGAEIARSEGFKEGRVPLHTFRSDISYHIATALTTYGIIGIKVWIYRGDVLPVKSTSKTAEGDE